MKALRILSILVLAVLQVGGTPTAESSEDSTEFDIAPVSLLAKRSKEDAFAEDELPQSKQVRQIGGGLEVIQNNISALLQALRKEEDGEVNEALYIMQKNPRFVNEHICDIIHVFDQFDEAVLMRVLNIVDIASARCWSKNSKFSSWFTPRLTALHEAARLGMKTLATYLIDRGVPLDATNQNGYSALHLAILHGHSELMRLLLQRGSSVDAIGALGLCAVQIAVRKSSHEMWKVLEEEAPMAISKYLSDAVYSHDIARIVGVLESGVGVDRINENGVALIHEASARPGSEEIIDVLLSRLGADVNLRSTQGETPIFFALRNGYKGDSGRTNVGVLLEHGARVDVMDAQGDTALVKALTQCFLVAAPGEYDVMTQRWLDVSTMVLQDGVSLESVKSLPPQLQQAILYQTIQSMALGESMINFASYLLDSGVTPELSSSFWNGASALHIASSFQDTRVLRKLLKHYNNFDLPTPQIHLSPLFFAVYAGSTGAAQVLLEAGADPNSLDIEDDSLLISAQFTDERLDDMVYQATGLIHLTDRVRSSDVLQLLVDFGADINYQDSKGRTALHIALKNEEISEDDIVALLRMGADPSIRNTKGVSPLEHNSERLQNALALLKNKSARKIVPSAEEFTQDK